MTSWGAVPVSKVERPGRPPLEVFRCQTDGALVTMKQESLERHAGHRVKQPVILTDEEKQAIEDGRIN